MDQQIFMVGPIVASYVLNDFAQKYFWETLYSHYTVHTYGFEQHHTIR